MEAAPLFSDIAKSPEGGQAWWIRTEDGVRLRIAMWPAATAATPGPRGTVLLFPGRTEYVEKYGLTAVDLCRAGYTVFSVDWRGQGLADRLIDDPMPGHILKFSDYQKDVTAFLSAARELNLPKPWHLLAHSMGGCIGLRALMGGMDVASCVFSGPMWGIQISKTLRPLAWALSWGSRQIGMDHVYAPGTKPDSYVLTEPFETNMLTSDREMYQYMINQVRGEPALILGGPSLRWLNEALRETRHLSRLPSPDLPCLTYLGSDEDIVDPTRIYDRMRRWPRGELKVIDGGQHEVLMDNPQMRGRVLQEICAFFGTVTP